MIDRNTAVTQINRLSKLRGAPDPNDKLDRIALEEVIKALMKTADHDIHAFDIVTEILEKSQFFPVPADIYGQRREQPWKPRLAYQCATCEDTGWRHEADGGQGRAVRCSCRPVPKAPEPPAKRGGGMQRAGEVLR